MSSRYVYKVVIVVSLVSLLLAGCQAPPQSASTPSAAEIEQLKAEAIQQELLTFDLMIKRDWAAYDALTDPDFYQVGSDGAYVERDAALGGLNDDKLVVKKPDLGEMRVEMISPDAYMVTYPMNFNGSYDGNDFSNPRTVTSLWVKHDGKWQNRFLVDQIREAAFTPVNN
ncbi:MAG: nuclear transport factor 2 family protein [Anaerolineales bacterium]|nr:nuclear transport factor 2 family protein [Anaerolineales bacterium]